MVNVSLMTNSVTSTMTVMMDQMNGNAHPYAAMKTIHCVIGHRLVVWCADVWVVCVCRGCVCVCFAYISEDLDMTTHRHTNDSKPSGPIPEGYIVERWVRGCAAQIGCLFVLSGLPMAPFLFENWFRYRSRFCKIHNFQWSFPLVYL